MWLAKLLASRNLDNAPKVLPPTAELNPSARNCEREFVGGECGRHRKQTSQPCRSAGLRSSCGMSIVQVEKSKMNSGFIGRLNPKPELLDQAAHFDVLPEQVGLH